MEQTQAQKSNRIKSFSLKIKKLIDEIYSGEFSYNKRITRYFVNAYKVFVVSTKKFMDDDCFTKASSIAYTTLVSLIPTLTVILTFYSIFSGVGDKKEELFAQVTNFMIDHNIRLNIDPILEAVSGFIENAGKIGGISAATLIISATALFRTLDKSLNKIWNIKKGRSLFLKIIYFWTTLSLGPILIISGNALANQLKSAISSPDYHSADVSGDGKIWTVGNKATIIYSDYNTDYSDLDYNNIDFDNQLVYQYNVNEKKFTKQEYKIEELEFGKTEFTAIQFIKKSGWITGKNGMLLISEDYGRSWKIRKYGSYGFNDIHMSDPEKGFIVSDGGYLLITEDGWRNVEIMEWNDINSRLKSISFYDNIGIITGERGLILISRDSGATWETMFLAEARINKRYTNINNSFFINKSRIILACNEGLILVSSDSGMTWEKRKFKNDNYYSAFFHDMDNGYIAGAKGIFISTNDGGNTWKKETLKATNINKIFYTKNNIYAFGNNGLILNSADNGLTWTGKKGRNIILFIINFFAPFVYIWLLFLMIYRFFPNTKVPFKPAAIGAAFTGIVWVVFLIVFEIYIKSFAKSSFAIYGALAVIPLFLLMIYTSVLIVLYGAEVSYTLMHPQTYMRIKKNISREKDIFIYNGISLLYFIYEKFEKGKGPSSRNELLKLFSNSNEELDYFINIFKKENLIMDSGEGNYLPANSSKNIYLDDIIALVHNIGMYIPGIISKKEKLKQYVNSIFNKIRQSNEEILKGIRLSDVIEKVK